MLWLRSPRGVEEREKIRWLHPPLWRVKTLPRNQKPFHRGRVFTPSYAYENRNFHGKKLKALQTKIFAIWLILTPKTARKCKKDLQKPPVKNPVVRPPSLKSPPSSWYSWIQDSFIATLGFSFLHCLDVKMKLDQLASRSNVRIRTDAMIEHLASPRPVRDPVSLFYGSVSAQVGFQPK